MGNRNDNSMFFIRCEASADHNIKLTSTLYLENLIACKEFIDSHAFVMSVIYAVKESV